MYMTCKRCGSKHFLVSIITQSNGNDDTYEFVCGGCGDCIDLPEPEFNDYATYLVREIDGFKNKNESICLEEWVEEGTRLFYISLYKNEELVGYKDFSTAGEASICYKKCTELFDSLGSLDPVIKLFDDY